ncbi:MAG: LysR family transcriptional regulator, partial [Gammaproteobacteria bacterium]|nr:LysR family transcriptional regulator [Gammaproteobacteria bacterium]
MDLNRIYYFVTVIECGSYTKAALKINVPKSTLSRHIQGLESDLQLRLLNRSTRKLSLTKAGESFFKDCQPLVTHLQNAHAHISQYHKDVTGKLRVTMPTEIGTNFLNVVLPKFMAQHPKISLEFDFSTENHNLIEAGYDLAIRIGKLEDSSYIARRIASPKLQLYASPSYLLSSGGIKEIAEI